MCLALPPHTLRVNSVKAVTSFLCVVSVSGGDDDAEPGWVERNDSAQKPLPALVSSHGGCHEAQYYSSEFVALAPTLQHIQ